MIDPPPAATIRSPTSAASRNGPLRLTAMTCRQLLGDIGQLAVERRQAGVVDQHVDAAEVAVDVLDERVESVPVADMARRTPPPRALRPRSARGHVARTASPLRLTTTTSAPALGERPGHREAEAAGATGHDRPPARQVEEVARGACGEVSAGSCMAATSWASGSIAEAVLAVREAGGAGQRAGGEPCASRRR